MPWIGRGSDTKFVAPPSPNPQVYGPLPPGVSERDPAAWDQRRRERAETWNHIHRVVVDFLEFHKHCPRHACRRAGACRSKTVACHEEAFPVLKERFYPRLVAAIREAPQTPAPAGSENPEGKSVGSAAWRQRR